MAVVRNSKTVVVNSNMNEYWNMRYKDGGKVWGDTPSLSAKQASILFESNKIESVLVPGCGYGRHTGFFDRLGFDVDGIEISHEAITLAKATNTQVKYYEGSVLDMPYSDIEYDAIYCFNVLHLLMDDDRKRFIELCREALKDEGYIYFTSISEEDESYATGAEIEDNTYESKPGRPVHYFTEDDLLNSFNGFEVLGTGIIDETENHGEQGAHIHRVRYIFAKKSEIK